MKYYFIGTDEAGYGPNLGPLVVSASLWKAELPETDEEPLSAFNRRVDSALRQTGAFTICDSKKLYHTGHLAPLERSFFFALEMAESVPIQYPLFHTDTSHFFNLPWKKITERLAAVPESEKQFLPPWEIGSAFSLPLTDQSHWQKKFCTDFSETCSFFEDEKVSLLGIRSKRIHPEEFNLLLEEKGRKSEIAADATLGTALSLLHPLLQKTPRNEKKEILLICDKLGGRNSYGNLLERFFPGIPIAAEQESRPISSYSFRVEKSNIRIVFQAKGESNIPTAMASILSKYLREISMEAFNRYWREKIPGIKPTAGYPLDAKRFRSETESFRIKNGIEDRIFWRNK